MAELPNLGRHCDAELCNLLDFLPIRCDACSGTFCVSHFTYDGHQCKNAYEKNVQVPTCPLCDKPVPTPKGVPPDVEVNEHIQNNCAQGAKKKIFANRCTVRGCKKRELVPITCPSCRQNYCLGHRHEKDHNCEQIKGNPVSSKAAAAALARNRGSQNCASQARNMQISEDEALARALAASMDEVNISPEERDRRLAEQLQAQEYRTNSNPAGQRNTRAVSGNTNTCSIS